MYEIHSPLQGLICLVFLAAPLNHPPPGGLPPPEAYAISPDEKAKYDGLFKTYDTERTG